VEEIHNVLATALPPRREQELASLLPTFLPKRVTDEAAVLGPLTAKMLDVSM
jgi:hypothetical protein